MQHREQKGGSWLGRIIVLLVISAGLFSCLFLPPHSGPTPARRAEAYATVRNIVNALKSYQNDYGKFPPIEVKGRKGGGRMLCFGDPACKISDGPNSLIFDVLRAIPRGANTNHQLNKRPQIYFEAPNAKDPKAPRSGFADGPEFPDALQGCLFDPWGRQYCIVLAIDDSGTLDLSAVYSAT